MRMNGSGENETAPVESRSNAALELLLTNARTWNDPTASVRNAATAAPVAATCGAGFGDSATTPGSSPPGEGRTSRSELQEIGTPAGARVTARLTGFAASAEFSSSTSG